MVMARDVDVTMILTGAGMEKQGPSWSSRRKRKYPVAAVGSFHGNENYLECLSFLTVWAWSQLLSAIEASWRTACPQT